MGSASMGLMKLRPVTFHYRKPDARGRKPLQYGLIAEEVAQVMPELVLFDRNGRPESVAYHVLPTLLLNELQREHALNQEFGRQLAAQQRRIEAQDAQLATLQTQLAEVVVLKARLAELERRTEILAGSERTGPARPERASCVGPRKSCGSMVAAR
jgi:hypothetical protein